MKIIEEIYDHIYGEIQQVSPEDEMFRKEIIRLLKPLEKREDWEQLSDIIMEVSALSQKYGFTSGFKLGMILMIECGQ